MTLGQDRQILSSLWLLMFAASSQVMVIAPLLSSIGAEFNVATAALGNLLTVYAATVGVFALVAGPISDRVGRRQVLLWGSVLMTGALALHCAAWSYLSLLAFRTLAGIGGGVLSGAIVALVGDHFPRERRGWANGWIMTGLATGQILGVPVGTLLAGESGYRAPFAVLAVICGLAALSVYFFVPQIPTQAGGLNLRSAMDGYRSLLVRRTTLGATATCIAVFFGIASFMTYLPTWLETEFGFTSTMVAALYLIGGVGTIYAGPRAGSLSDHAGRKAVILWSTFGLVGFTLLVPAGAGLAMAIVFPTFLGVNIFLSARASAFQAMLTELVGSHQRGSLMSVTTAAGQLGFASGAAAAGPMFAGYGFGGNAAVAAIAAASAGALVWWLVPEALDEDIHIEGGCPCNQLQIQSGLCGPTPESGHMAGALQAQTDQRKLIEAEIGV